MRVHISAKLFLQVRSFNRFGAIIAFNAQKLGVSWPWPRPVFEKISRGRVRTVPINMPVKFEVRSYNRFWAIRSRLPTPKLLGRFSKKCRIDYVRDPTPHVSTGVSRFKGGVCTHAWNCHPQASIFPFLGSMRLATGRPVGPIVAGYGSRHDAPWWPSRSFYGFVNKINIFPIFYPKLWKIALHPMGTFVEQL